MFTLSIIALAPARLRLKTQVLKLEHPPQERTVIPQVNDDESLALIRTYQVDETRILIQKKALVSPEVQVERGWQLRLSSWTSPYTLPNILLGSSKRWNPPRLLLFQNVLSFSSSWLWNRLQDDNSESPTILHLDRAWLGSANSMVGPLATDFVWLAEKWVLALSIGCRLLGTSVHPAVWVLLISVM